MNERIKAAAGAVVLALVQVLGIFGIGLSDNIVAVVLFAVVMLLTLAVGIWKNFNFTDAAGLCQQILNAMKRYDAEVIEQAKELAAKAVEDDAADKAAAERRN